MKSHLHYDSKNGEIPKKGENMYIPNMCIRNQEFSNEDIAVWLYCAMEIYGPWKTYGLISTTQITYQIYHTCDISHGITDRIAASLKHLIETNMLLGQRVGKQYYEIRAESFDMKRFQNTQGKQEPFIQVDEAAIRTIFIESKRPFAILRYYLLMLTTIDTKTKVGTWKSETLANMLGIDVATLTRYYKSMENLKLLYVYRGLHSSNTYGRYENKDLIISAGNKRSDGKRLKTSANHKRQMTQWYNQIKRGNPKYTEDVYIMEEVRGYCETTNEQEMELAAQKPHYVPKLYDMSIFS